MSPKEFGTLKRYAMKMTRDEDDRDELVLQAYEEGVRLGDRRSIQLLVNFMKLRSREMNRSFVGAKLGGKSIRDVWHHKPVSLSKPIDDSSHYAESRTMPSNVGLAGSLPQLASVHSA